MSQATVKCACTFCAFTGELIKECPRHRTARSASEKRAKEVERMMNNIKPIRTEAACEAALLRIEELMDAEAGSREGWELDVLADLVQLYEAKTVGVLDTATASGYSEAYVTKLRADIARLREAVEALGVIGDGYCFCHHNRDERKDDHKPECDVLRKVLEAK